MNLTRYDNTGICSAMEPNPEGRYILHSDVAALVAEKEREVKDAKEAQQRLVESTEFYAKESEARGNELATLRAEVERLREDWKRMYEIACFRNSPAWAEVRGLASRHINTALAAAPVATDDGSCEDRAILDWLENASAVNRRSAVGVQRNGVEADVEWWEVSNGEVVGTGDTLREAVRTALLPPPPAQEGEGK